MSDDEYDMKAFKRRKLDEKMDSESEMEEVMPAPAGRRKKMKRKLISYDDENLLEENQRQEQNVRYLCNISYLGQYFGRQVIEDVSLQYDLTV